MRRARIWQRLESEKVMHFGLARANVETDGFRLQIRISVRHAAVLPHVLGP